MTNIIMKDGSLKPFIRADKKKFYLVSGSMQYFKGDVDRIQAALRKYAS